MIAPYIVAVVVLVSLAVAWALIQAAWRRTFADAAPGEDALAGRLGCHGCGECTRDCERRPVEPAAAEEDLP